MHIRDYVQILDIVIHHESGRADSGTFPFIFAQTDIPSIQIKIIVFQQFIRKGVHMSPHMAASIAAHRVIQGKIDRISMLIPHLGIGRHVRIIGKVNGIRDVLFCQNCRRLIFATPSAWDFMMTPRS